MALRLLPLIGSLVLIGIVFCWRPWLQFRRYGTLGIILFRSQGVAQNLRDAMAVVLFFLIVAQAVVWAGWPESLSPLVATSDQAFGWLQAIGGVVLFAGIALLVKAQLELGVSWRIGIEEDASPGLMTGGLYRFCRNPIFLALLIVVTGYALLLPTRLSIILALGTYVGIRLQVSAEEAYLLHVYGERYREYARRVGRFLPGLGKSR